MPLNSDFFFYLKNLNLEVGRRALSSKKKKQMYRLWPERFIYCMAEKFGPLFWPASLQMILFWNGKSCSGLSWRIESIEDVLGETGAPLCDLTSDPVAVREQGRQSYQGPGQRNVPWATFPIFCAPLWVPLVFFFFSFHFYSHFLFLLFLCACVFWCFLGTGQLSPLRESVV